ncbi:MAG TPA: hypothetical protein V6D12_14140 [Candidatus Obscuribacterales bacterium]
MSGINEKSLEWYVEAFKHEVKRFMGDQFVGNVEFQINIKHGDITNMNVGLNKSLRMPVKV